MVGCPFDRLSCGADLARSALPVAVGLCLPAAAPIDGQSGGRERVLLESFEFSKTRGHAIGAPRLTIAPRVEPQEITWQLIEASIAVSVASACSVRTSVRHGPCCCQTTWVSQSSPPPATRARTEAAETPRTSRGTAAASLAHETRAGPILTEGAGSARKLTKGDKPASRSNKRPVYK